MSWFRKKQLESNEYQLLWNKLLEVQAAIQETNIKVDAHDTQIKQLRGKMNSKLFRESETEDIKNNDPFDFVRGTNL